MPAGITTEWSVDRMGCFSVNGFVDHVHYKVECKEWIQIETDKLGLFNIENLKPANYTFTATLKKKTVKFKLKAWPKNNQSIKDLLDYLVG